MTRFLAVLGVLSISFSAIFVRLADVAPSTAAFFRTAYALPVLAAVWCIGRGRDTRGLRERWLAILAGIILGVDLTVWHRSIALIGAGLATVLANTQVVFVALAAWRLHRERPSRWALGALPVALVGVCLISGLGGPEAYGRDPVLGVILGVLTGVTYAAFVLLLRAANRRSVPPAGPLLDATVGAAVACLALGYLDGGLDLRFAWPSHGWLVAMALVSQSVGWLLITRTLPRLAALETSLLLLLQPVGALVWAWLIFAERLSLLQGSGAVLVVAAVGMLTVMGRAVHRSGERPVERLDGEPEAA